MYFRIDRLRASLPYNDFKNTAIIASFQLGSSPMYFPAAKLLTI